MTLEFLQFYLDVKHLKFLILGIDFLEFICYNVGTTKRKEMIHMKTTTFSVSNLTDTDLSNLFHSCAAELQKRADQRTKRRAEWIHNHYWGFVGHPNASIQTTGNRTIVALYNRYDGVRIGTSYPINGDVYDENTGIAVAYAKAMGERIPDYI